MFDGITARVFAIVAVLFAIASVLITHELNMLMEWVSFLAEDIPEIQKGL